MFNTKEVVDNIKNSSLRYQVKILVGGAPITQKFCISVGADGYAPDAGSAVIKAKQLIGAIRLDSGVSPVLPHQLHSQLPASPGS